MSNTNEVDVDEKWTLTQTEQDMIGEIANISFGSASTALATLLNTPVNITTPHVEVVDLYDGSDVEIPHVVLEVNFIKGIEMTNLLVIKKEVALIIADIMMMGSGEIDPEQELTELELSAVKEAMNQMIGNAATSMSNLFNALVDITPPNIKVVTIREELENVTQETSSGVKVAMDLQVGDRIKSKLVQIIPLKNAKELVGKLLGANEIAEESIMSVSEAEKMLYPQESDILREICNIAIGSASTIMSTLFNRKVSIGVSHLDIITLDSLQEEVDEKFILSIDFIKGVNATNRFILSKESTLIMADLMMMGTGENVDVDKDLTEFEISAMQELMNQMMGNAATAMTTLFEESVDITPPAAEQSTLKATADWIQNVKQVDEIVEVWFDLEVEGLIKTTMSQYFIIDEAKELVNKQIAMTNKRQQIQKTKEEVVAESSVASTPQVEVEEKNVTVQPIEMTDFSAVSKDDSYIYQLTDRLTGVETHMKFIFGTTSATLEQFLQFEENEIIELVEGISDPIKILVNNILIGYGELVNVDGYFGVKILGLVKN